jgi:hypothetical protein
VRAIVFLLLGAVVNVAVAWMFVLNHGFGTTWDFDEPITQYIQLWKRYAPVAFGPEPEGGEVEPGYVGYTLVFFDVADVDDPIAGETMRDGSIVLSGWPTQSLVSYRFHTRNLTADTPWTDVVNTYIVLRENNPVTDTSSVILTRMPIWPGFALNTLFYAAILWLLFAFPFALRRWRRRRNGLCTKCAYPVGASDVCTECGKPVASLRAGEST